MSAVIRPSPDELPDGEMLPPSEIDISTEAPTDYAAVLARLAALSLIEYDRCRVVEAEQLGVRVTILDAEVERSRGEVEPDVGDGALILNDPEPWPEAVNGDELLHALVAALRRHVVMADHFAEIVALWAIHCHAFENWRHTPRLNITAPEKGCGKSTLLDVLACLVPRSIKTENLSTAVLFRIVDKARPTLLIDEVDSFLKDNEELRGCLNAGHEYGGSHLRCEGDNNDVRAFKTFAPAALAGIGNLPATLADRSLSIVLQRRRPDEFIEYFRADRAGHLHNLASQIARWVQDHKIALADTEPPMPEGIHNRLADNWRPLLAIAQVAGGNWPKRVRLAAVKLSNNVDDDAESIKIKLLADIRDIFQSMGKDKLSSEQIINRLHAMEGRPWPEYGRSGKQITKNQMARLLKPFAIAPRTIRDGETTIKGYRRRSFDNAFSGYLPPQTVTPSQPAETQGFSEIQSVTSIENVTVVKSPKPKEPNACDGITDEDPDLWEDTA